MTVFQVSLPSIAQVGQILNVKITIDSGLWGDRQYSGYTYKWQYSLNGNWIDINTPSFPFYTVQHSDAGKYIRCVVTLDRDGSIANSSQTSIFESNLSYNTNQSDPNSKISIVNEVENINAIEGRKFSIYFDRVFNLYGSGVNYTINTASGSPLPNWIAIDPLSGEVKINGYEGLVGSFDFYVGAHYKNSSSANDYFTINIAPYDKNYVPDKQIQMESSWFYQLPDQFFQKATALNLTVFSATLSDGSQLPEWLTFDAEKRTLSGRPPKFFDETLAIRISATALGVAGEFSLKLQDFFDLKVGEGADREALGSISILGKPGSFQALNSISDPDGQISQTIFIWETSDRTDSKWNEIARFADNNNFNFSLYYDFKVNKYLRVLAITKDINDIFGDYI